MVNVRFGAKHKHQTCRWLPPPPPPAAAAAAGARGCCWRAQRWLPRTPDTHRRASSAPRRLARAGRAGRKSSGAQRSRGATRHFKGVQNSCRSFAERKNAGLECPALEKCPCGRRHSPRWVSASPIALLLLTVAEY